jgi:YNFM family putative membrane transporter
MTVRYGRGPVMLGFTGVMLCGLLLTLFSSLWLIFIGMLLFSAGFFAAHSVASSWIGPRARRARGQASSLYLFSYYLGSSLAGTLGGYSGITTAGTASVGLSRCCSLPRC